MTDNTEEAKLTPLYDRHVALGARIIPFAGWMMPVQYKGIIHEHKHVRQKSGLFDLGHMGQVEVDGEDALAFLQYVATNDVSKLEPGAAQYALLTNENGGVIDDIIIYRPNEGDGYFVCVNASNKDKDVAWNTKVGAADRTDLDVTVTDISDKTGMIAIQVPDAEQIMTPLVANPIADLDNFAWMPMPSMAFRSGWRVLAIPVKTASKSIAISTILAPFGTSSMRPVRIWSWKPSDSARAIPCASKLACHSMATKWMMSSPRSKQASVGQSSSTRVTSSGETSWLPRRKRASPARRLASLSKGVRRRRARTMF